MSVRMLVVDDEEEIRSMLARHYTLKDFEVVTAENGAEALKVLENQHVDIAISDIRMPEMDGVQLLRIIREQYPMVRVIMITGYVTLSNALACMRRGADTVVFKPLLDLDEIDQSVELSLAALQRWQEKLRSLQGMKREGRTDPL